MDKFEKNFLKVSLELEKLCKNFSIKGKIPKAHQGIWLPKKEVRAWAIPRSSGQLLRMLVLANKPRTILELGTSFGYSALWLASGVRQYGGRVYTVDLIKPKIKTAKKYFKKAKLDGSITQIGGKISDVLNKWNKKVDFVFMDADKSNYLSYIKQLEPHIKKGTLIIADNAVNFGYLMKDYIAYMTNGGKYCSHLLKMDNGLLLSVKL